MWTHRPIRTLALALGVAGAATCSSESTTPSDLQDAASLVADITPELVATLDEAFQEENLALYTYRAVIADFGALNPFRNIEPSESTHVAAIGGLYAQLGLTPPLSAWTVANVERFATFSGACAGGVAIELADAALYDRLLGQALPDEVVQVFTNLRRASVAHHLPAFTRCQ